MLPTRNKFYASRICNQKSPETDHFYTSPKPIYEQHRPTPSDHTFCITRVPRTWVSEVPKWNSSEDHDDGELPSGSGRLELIHKLNRCQPPHPASQAPTTRLLPTISVDLEQKICFEKTIPRNPEAIWVEVDVSGLTTCCAVSTLMTLLLL